MAGPINQKRQMRVETVPLATLRLDPGNANIHDDEDVDSIAAKLAQFGQVEPLVVQSGTHRVIGGNGRLMAMVKLGWAECAVTYVGAVSREAPKARVVPASGTFAQLLLGAFQDWRIPFGPSRSRAFALAVEKTEDGMVGLVDEQGYPYYVFDGAGHEHGIFDVGGSDG